MSQEFITPGSAAWRVKYNDDSELALYKPDGSETAYQEIEWDRVKELIFESQLYTSTFEIRPNRLPRGHVMSLRARNFLSLTRGGLKTMCYVLLISAKDKPVEESTIWAMYWFPDGTTHTCSEFDCSSVREYGIPKKTSKQVGIPDHHGALQVGLDANII